MFFKNFTVYEIYKTRRGAEAYIARFLANQENIRIEDINGQFAVVG
jgi:hypothetical protein